MLLERMGPNISNSEKNKLSNLKEQKKRLAEQGIEMKGTVVPRFPCLPNDKRTGFQSKMAINSMEEASKSGNDKIEDAEEVQVAHSGGQGVAGPYLMFIQVEREKLTSKDPGAKLDHDSLQRTWSNKSVEEKRVYSDMFNKKMKELGKNFRKDIKSNSLSEKEKKVRRKVADKAYRERRKEDLDVKKKEEDLLKAKLEEIVVEKP